MRNSLPTDDLKHYGILNENNSFSTKLSAQEIQGFLEGKPLLVENKNTSLVFQLTENKTRLTVNYFELNKNLSQIANASQNEIEYASVKELSNPENPLSEQRKVFVFDEKTKQITEFDLLKDNAKLTQIIAERKSIEESHRYKTELLKLKDFLQEKIDKFPEIAKEITNDLNIVSKTINTIDDATPNESQAQKQEKSDIQLNVNDPDLYQDANREREEAEEIEQQQERRRGFRR